MKKYKYKGKIYCDKDSSEEIDNYGGSLDLLYRTMWYDGIVDEAIIYYCPKLGRSYDSKYEFMEDYCETLED